MANTAQARKRARQSLERNAHNAAQRSEMRTALKKVRKAIAAGDKTVAEAQLRASQSIIDAIADKKVFHKNTASRYKSRLAAAIKAMP
jgi:small subunit ribosomal protein S20